MTPKKRFIRMPAPPWLELLVLIGTVAVSYVALLIIAGKAPVPEEGMVMTNIVILLLGFLLLSFAIAVIAVMAGIGGGVVYTPLMLAFTPVNSLIVRATGLIVAMFSGLVSTGPFMKRGIGTIKISIACCAGYGIGGFIGARCAVYVAKTMGSAGEGFLRLALGLIVLILGVYFLLGGVKRDWPVIPQGVRTYQSLGASYFEPSMGRTVTYKVARFPQGLLFMFGIGLISGFFGLGAGWAIVPILNFVMAVPLKVAASLSGIIIGMGDCITVWPYLYSGAIIPLFVAPWLVGQVLGGMVGAQVLIHARSDFIRIILIGIMYYTSYGLISNALEKIGVIGAIPAWFSVAVLLAVLAWVVTVILRRYVKSMQGEDPDAGHAVSSGQDRGYSPKPDRPVRNRR